MSRLLRCPHGHHWEPSAPSGPSAAPALCPVCGATVAEPHDVVATAVGGRPLARPADAVYEAPTIGPAPGMRRVSEPAGPPQVPGYQILREIGKGGMGIVYKAHQASLNRPVALKMLLPGAYCGPAEMARFRAEAEAAARLQHPHIVHIHEIGETGGRPYFSMEYVDGGNLAARLHGNPVPARAAARFVETLARAVQAAHDAGVIHRDLKPANVLLQRRPAGARTDGDHPHDPLAGLDPKITDFGLAQQLGRDSGQAVPGGILGTPSYMAPEQVDGKARDMGASVDVYALGAILYETLTGRPPFRAATPLDTVLQVISEEPMRPSRLQFGVPHDPETICLKCLHKDPRKRYATPLALADDLHRFLSHRPILARPTPFWERAYKWARRRPSTAALVVVLTLLGVGALSGGTARWLHVEQRVGRAEADREEKSAQLYAALVPLARNDWLDNHVDLARQRLEDCPPQARHWEWYYLRRLCEAGLLTVPGGDSGVALSADGSHLAVASPADVTIWDADGRAVAHIAGAIGPPVALSPDGRTLFAQARLPSSSARQAGGPAGVLKAWDVSTGQERSVLPGQVSARNVFALSGDGRRLAAATAEGQVRVWDLDGRLPPALTLPRKGGGIQGAPVGQVGNLPSLPPTRKGGGDLDPRDGGGDVDPREGGGNRTSARGEAGGTPPTLSPSPSVTLIPPAPTRPREEGGTKGSIEGLALSHDGLTAASVSSDGTVRVWDAAAGRLLNTFPWDDPEAAPTRAEELTAAADLAPHVRGPHPIALAPDGRLLACGQGGMVHLRDLKSGHDLHLLSADADHVACLAFRPDGQQLATAGANRAIVIWDVRSGHELFRLRGHGNAIQGLAWSGDGRRLASSAADHSVRLWDATTGLEARMLAGHRGPVRAVAFTPSGQLISAGADGMVWRRDPDAVDPGTTLHGPPGPLACVATDPQGRVAAGCADGTVRLWDGAEHEVQTFTGHTNHVLSVAFSRDGKRLASAGRDGVVRLWDAATGTCLRTLEGHGGAVHAVSFSPEGRLASAGADGIVRLWDPDTGQPVFALAGHEDAVVALGFSPDGRRLASAGLDGMIILWDATGGREVLRCDDGRPGPPLRAVAFSPRDDTRLATADARGLVRLWDAGTGREVLTLPGHRVGVFSLAFSANARWLATADADGAVRLRDAAPLPARPPEE